MTFSALYLNIPELVLIAYRCLLQHLKVFSKTPRVQEKIVLHFFLI